MLPLTYPSTHTSTHPQNKTPQGLVDGDGAIMLVEPRHLDQLLHPTFENEKAYQRDVITRGLGASPGAAVGKLVFTAGAFICLSVWQQQSGTFVYRTANCACVSGRRCVDSPQLPFA